MTAPELSAIYRNALTGKRLDSLRRAVQTPSRAEIKEVAEQFEALFVQRMLEAMRDATPQSELFGSGAMRQYRALFDQQIALNVAHGEGLGLAEMVAQQMLRQAGLTQSEADAGGRNLSDYRQNPIAARAPLPQAGSGASHHRVGAAPPPRTPGPGDKAPAWPTPEAFVHAIWPHAQRTARRLGIPPRALLAQAVLETGWGQHVIRGADDRPSYNLFNIKAGPGWHGERVRVPTLEYRHGIAVRERAEFRAYDSVAAAFRDYAELLRGNPRYAEALRSSDDAAAFARALEAAGYATDPHYAEKIQRILGSDTLSTLDSGVKKTSDGTTT